MYRHTSGMGTISLSIISRSCFVFKEIHSFLLSLHPREKLKLGWEGANMLKGNMAKRLLLTDAKL